MGRTASAVRATDAPDEGLRAVQAFKPFMDSLVVNDCVVIRLLYRPMPSYHCIILSLHSSVRGLRVWKLILFSPLLHFVNNVYSVAAVGSQTQPNKHLFRTFGFGGVAAPSKHERCPTVLDVHIWR